MCNTATLTREASTDQGTFGVLVAERNGNRTTLQTLELPWRMNQRGISCIPPGDYLCSWFKSPSRGWVYRLLDVPDRDGILIHAGNWAGNTERSWHSDVRGCILLGHCRGHGTPAGRRRAQAMVVKSALACKALADFFARQDFTLRIVGPPGAIDPGSLPTPASSPGAAEDS